MAAVSGSSLNIQHSLSRDSGRSVLRFLIRPDSCFHVHHLIPVSIHESVFPDRLDTRLCEALRSRRIDPKFHYLTPKQARAWLALARGYSPFLSNPNGPREYDSAYQWTLERLSSKSVHLLSLACGGAHKETHLIGALARMGRTVRVTITDASLALVLTAYRAIGEFDNVTGLHAIVCDIMDMENPTEILAHDDFAETVRILTCFGLLPNVDPRALAMRLARLLRKGDVLLTSANLASGQDYERSVHALCGQYDNPATREWLSLLLFDAGFERDDGEILFRVVPCTGLPDLLQIAAVFRTVRARTIRWGNEEIAVSAGDEFHLFFSNRYTSALVRRVFNMHGMSILQQWISAESNEGVFAATLAEESEKGGSYNQQGMADQADSEGRLCQSASPRPSGATRCSRSPPP